MPNKLIFLFLLSFSFLNILVHATEPVSLTMNIISHSLNNGAGKEVDVSIIKEEFERLGHHVNLCDFDKVTTIPSADINLFLAQFRSEWFSKANLNWFIPNAEFCSATPKDLKKFDLILCKTQASLNTFQSLSKRTYYLGFTSLNRYQPDQVKNFLKYLHVAGKSKMKGTNSILHTWLNHPQFPKLTMINHRPYQGIKVPKNVKLITKRVSTQSLLTMQNECGIHLCPSKTEGFGHYLMEAMSVGAVVVTTDAPPMNEFIRDSRCLVKYKTTAKKKYATLYMIDERELAHVVELLQELPIEELQKIGQANREEYLKRTAEFKENFEKLIQRTVHELYGNEQTT